MEFREWFTQELKRRGMSDRQFALYANVSPHAPRTWRLGSSRPSYENCAAIARVMKVEGSFVRRMVGYYDEAANEPEPDLTAEERDLILTWREAGPQGRQLLQMAARTVRESTSVEYKPGDGEGDR